MTLDDDILLLMKYNETSNILHSIRSDKFYLYVIIIIIIITIEHIKSITSCSPPISLSDHHHLPKSQYFLLTMRGSIFSSHNPRFLKSSSSNTPRQRKVFLAILVRDLLPINL